MKKTLETPYGAKAAYDILKKYNEYATEKNTRNEFVNQDIFSKILKNIPGTVMVIDLHTNLYVYVNTPQIVGYDSKEFAAAGLARVIRIFPASHAYILTHHIFPTMFKYFEEYCSQGKSHGIKVTYQTQLIHKDGSIRWYQHTISVLSTDDLNRPNLLLKSIYDIQDFKKDTYIDFTITHTNDDSEMEILYEERFLPEITHTLLSEREGQILSLICTGLTSAQIAEKLFISQHTVNTHRKNILRKTFCKGTADLAIYALTAGGGE